MVSIEVNSIMLSMCRSFDSKVVLLLILSRASHWMRLMFMSLLIIMCTFVVRVIFYILPLLLFFWWDFERFGLFWLVG